MTPNMQPETRKRGKYGRPCDRCATRRIRCLMSGESLPCKGCLSIGEQCTRDRVRKKSGPKGGRRSRTLKSSLVEFGERVFLAPIPNDNNISITQQDPSNDQSLSGWTSKGYFRFHDALPAVSVHLEGISRNSQMTGAPSTQLLDIFLAQTPPAFESREPFDPCMNFQGFPESSNTHPYFRMYSQYSIQPVWSMGYNVQPQAHPKLAHLRSCETTSSTKQDDMSIDRNDNETNPIPIIEGHDDSFSILNVNKSSHMAKFSTTYLILRIQLYQTWFYGYWPVISPGDLIMSLLNETRTSSENGHIVLSSKNAMLYALCCSICAASTTQISFVSPENIVLPQSAIADDDFADEAKRVRNFFDYTDRTEVNTMLSSFFLYAHYANQKGKMNQAKLYLREAILMAQVLGLHDKNQYLHKSRAETHHWRKIYYTLLVTERYVCFEEGLPVILDPCVKFPELIDEEFPDLLIGFSELIKIFSAPSKDFFFEINQNRLDYSSEEKPLHEKKKWILEVQEKLGVSHKLPRNVTSPQKLNIILSKAWIRAIACHITWKSGMIRLLEVTRDCFGFDFPLVNAREFLAESAHLPNMAFESNGPGVCVKLLEMANSLSFTVQQSLDQLAGLTVLESIFGLVNEFRNNVTLPIKVYRGIAELIAKNKLKVVPRLLESQETRSTAQSQQTDMIEELLEDEASHVKGHESLSLSSIDLPSYSDQIYDLGLGQLTAVPSFLDLQCSLLGLASQQNN